MNFTGPLEDRVAIRELCDQYAAGVMSKDLTMWAETWAEDAERTRLGATKKGRPAIVAETTQSMARFSVGAFFCNMGSTHVQGNRATGRCYQFELLFFGEGPAWFLSYYDDEYVKRDGRWYFLKRSLTLIKDGKVPAIGERI